MTTPERPPLGRPKGWNRHGEPVTEFKTIGLTKTAMDWIKAKPRGWLTAMLEEMARQNK